MTGNNILVRLAIAADNTTITSTAAQVVAAINANPEISALITATLNGTGASVVAVAGATALTDNLKAPARFPGTRSR